MLAGTEGDPIKVGVIGRLLVGFGSWLEFGDVGVLAEGLGSIVGFINLGARSLAWVLRRFVNVSFGVEFWVVLGSRLGSGFCSDASFSGLGSGSRLGLSSGLGSGSCSDSGVSGRGSISISRSGVGS